MKKIVTRHLLAAFFCLFCCSFKTFAQTKTLSVVFRVIDKGEPYGTGYNWSDTTVRNMVKFMNETYRRIPNTPGFGIPNYGIDTGIQFVLASKDPSGNPTSGIDHVNGNTIPGYVAHGLLLADAPDGTPYNINEMIGTAPYWNVNNYVVIYLVSSISSVGIGAGFNLFNNIYVSVPYGNPDPDQMARVINHEVGHYLDLYHTFENFGGSDPNGCPLNNNCTAEGDKVCDTPIHVNGMIPPQSCSNTGDPVFDTSYYWNVMSYDHMYGFTSGQRDRMRAALNTMPLNNHCLPSNLVITGVSAAAATFSYAGNTCPGVPVQFKYTGGGMPHAITWAFAGGSPSTSNELNPVVHFATGGNHLVSLSVANALGSGSTSANVTVASYNGAYLPFTQSFTGVAIPPPGSQTSKMAVGGAAPSAIKGLHPLNNPTGRPAPLPGRWEEITGTTISLYNTIHPKVDFYLSWQHPNGSDQIKVSVKNDCDANYTQVFLKSAADFISESGSSFSYKSEMADLSNYAGHVVTLKFELFRVTSGIVPDTAFNLHFDGYSVQAYPTVHIQSTSEMFKSCSDISDSYTAAVTDGGSNPSFQWLVDGISQNTITNNFSGKFAVGQQIECAVISNLPEAGTVPETAYSNIVAVQPSQTGTVKVVSNFYTTVANNIITITANGGNVKCSPFNTAYWLINGQYQAPNPLTGMITPTAYFYAAALKTGDTVQALQFHSGNPCPDLSPVYTIVDNSMYTRMAAQETTSPNPKLTLYPNPAFSNVTIAIDPALAKEAQEIILVNLLGQEVSRRKPDGTTNIILDVTGINNGLYIVMLKTKKETITQKLLIQH